MSVLIATDLDQTLIYSRSAVARWGGDARPLTAVETYQGVDASFMTASAAARLAELGEQALVVPATTRTVAQLARARVPGASRYAIAANGGILLVDGRPDPRWSRVVADRLADCAALAEIETHARQVCRPHWTTLVRTAEGLFCYAVIDRAAAPAELAETESRWAAERGWRVSLQGRKLYWVPQRLTKSAAVAEVSRRSGCDRVFAAGDSLLDADLVTAADAGIVARHGELVASGWSAPHVQVTAGEGVVAGEEMVAWFAGQVAPVSG